jgi:deoxyribodipyrimidine photolyase-related protein
MTCAKAVQSYEEGDAPLNSVEGFVRQILGWREYIRRIYWREMLDYERQNGLEADGTSYLAIGNVSKPTNT